MKTNQLHQSTVLFMSFIFLFLSIKTDAQTKKGSLGFRVSNTISANRCGPLWASSFYFISGRSTIHAGPMLQRDRLNLTGFQAGYEYTLLDPAIDQNCNLDWLEVYSWLSAAYHDKIYLGKNVCEEERRSNAELKVNVEDLAFKTVESYIGFGFRIDLLKNFKWFNAIGIGAYQVLNPEKSLYYNSRSVGMLMRTGLSYQFSKVKKANY